MKASLVAYDLKGSLSNIIFINEYVTDMSEAAKNGTYEAITL
jgi:hypothetical protein